MSVNIIPRFSFGVITDIQYADIPDGYSFRGVPRFYRHSLEALKRAVSIWNTQGGLSFVMHLGDIVDGFCPRNDSQDAVCRVVDVFKHLKDVDVYHVIGNHCLYNLSRDHLHQLLGIPSTNGFSYYTFVPVIGFRIVVLDGYDISALGWPDGHPHHLMALSLLHERNPNSNKNSPNGLEGLDKRFVMFNGAVSNDQLSWLHDVLEQAASSNEKVIVCSHIPFYPDVTFPAALLWNYAEVLDVIHKFNCVKVCLAGHTHTQKYGIDSHGVHHCVLNAVLECTPGTDAFGRMDVYDDHVSLIGVGCMTSIDMPFHH